MSMIRQLRTALLALLAMTVITGLLYPLVVYGIGRVAFADQAGGSLIERDGQVVGSELIGQGFGGTGVAPRASNSTGPRWFHPRPSAAGEDGYDGLASSGSNQGPSNPDLIHAIKERKAQVAKDNGVPESKVPPDAVTASSSGLDPHISPAYADIQADRVADARGLDPAVVRELIRENTDGKALGFLGEPGVNVVELNLALEESN